MKKSAGLLTTLLLSLLLFQVGVYSATNYEGLDAYYDAKIECGHTSLEFEKKWMDVMTNKSDLYSSSAYNQYHNDLKLLNNQGDLIEMFANQGMDIVNELNKYNNNIDSFKTKWNNYFNNLGKSGSANSSANTSGDDTDSDSSTSTTKGKKKKKTIKAPDWVKTAPKYSNPGTTQDAISSVLDPDGDGFYEFEPGINMNHNVDKIIWLEINEFGDLEVVCNCWKEVNGAWYYFGEDGYGVQGEQTIDGKKYYFYTSQDWKNSNKSKKVSEMAHDTVINGNIIGSDGIIK